MWPIILAYLIGFAENLIVLCLHGSKATDVNEAFSAQTKTKHYTSAWTKRNNRQEDGSIWARSPCSFGVPNTCFLRWNRSRKFFVSRTAEWDWCKQSGMSRKYCNFVPARDGAKPYNLPPISPQIFRSATKGGGPRFWTVFARDHLYSVHLRLLRSPVTTTSVYDGAGVGGQMW